MVAKSEAPKLVRRFVVTFNGKANSSSRTMTRMVGTLHTDNAGELAHGLREHRAHDQPTTRAPAERRGGAVHPIGVRAGTLLPRGGQ
eukprot:3952995-Prymnesium_polylepis.1